MHNKQKTIDDLRDCNSSMYNQIENFKTKIDKINDMKKEITHLNKQILLKDISKEQIIQEYQELNEKNLENTNKTSDTDISSKINHIDNCQKLLKENH